MARGAWMTGGLSLLCALPALPLAAAEISLREDGWYHWEVPAGAGGRHACCYEFRRGQITGVVGCRLGNGEGDLALPGNCDVSSDTMQVFVEVKAGRVRQIQPLSSACPVSIDAGMRTIEGVSTAASITWLQQQVDQDKDVAEDAIMALSFHAEDEALRALFAILEEPGQRQGAREHALFWLVQTGSEEAFAYIDRLLNVMGSE